MQIEVTHATLMTAIYCGLIASGYTYAQEGKDQEIIQLVEDISTWELDESFGKFFSQARQDTCAIYPYWPRAALMETATFYLEMSAGLFRFADFDAYRENVLQYNNLQADERDERFFAWIKDMPEALQAIMRMPAFPRIDEAMAHSVANSATQDEGVIRNVQEALTAVCRNADCAIERLYIVLNPLKCLYAADYYQDGADYYVLVGGLSVESVIHEFLHKLVHPAVIAWQERIIPASRGRDFGLDDSYYGSNGDASLLYAFEEYFVRLLTAQILDGKQDLDINKRLEAELKRNENSHQ